MCLSKKIIYYYFSEHTFFAFNLANAKHFLRKALANFIVQENLSQPVTHLFLAVEAVPGVAWPAGAVEASECVGARREQGAGPVLWGWGRCKNKQM